MSRAPINIYIYIPLFVYSSAVTVGCCCPQSRLDMRVVNKSSLCRIFFFRGSALSRLLSSHIII